jgi:hypothetical protein
MNIDDASSNGNPKILKWWKKNFFEQNPKNHKLKWSQCNGLGKHERSYRNIRMVEKITVSNANGQKMQWIWQVRMVMLKCWNGGRSSDFQCKWSENAIDSAHKNGYIEVLEWWKNSGLECKYQNLQSICD